MSVCPVIDVNVDHLVKVVWQFLYYRVTISPLPPPFLIIKQFGAIYVKSSNVLPISWDKIGEAFPLGNGHLVLAESM